MNHGRKLLILLLTTLYMSGWSDDESIEIHGAISQSFIYSKNNHYIFEGSKGGSLDFSEAYINFSKQFGSDLRVGLQIAARNFGTQEDFSPKLDWAYGDYRLHRTIGVRLGKVKLPFGIYNEARDIDFAKASIILDQGIYPENFRLVINSYSGGSLYGTFNINEKNNAELDYEVYYGTTSIPENYRSIQFTRRNFNSPTTDMNNVTLWGTSAQLRPFDNLLLGHSFMHNTTHLSINSSTLKDLDETGSGFFDFPVPFIEKAVKSKYTAHVLSAEMRIKSFTLISEYESSSLHSSNTKEFSDAVYNGISANFENTAYRDAILESVGIPVAGLDSLTLVQRAAGLARTFTDEFSAPIVADKSSWYIQALYQLTDDLGLFTGYGYTTQSNNANIKRLQEEQNTRKAKQKDYSIGVNYYVSDNFLLKGEYHYIDGLYGVYNPMTDMMIDDGNLWLARASYSF
ncbi:MAG: OprO/OprP family phosphate-selective porin [Fibrobacterales bacterium]